MSAPFRLYLQSATKRWLDGLRWRFALLIAPEIDVAVGKRRLEDVARECGASRAVAKKIAAGFFNYSPLQ